MKATPEEIAGAFAVYDSQLESGQAVGEDTVMTMLRCFEDADHPLTRALYKYALAATSRDPVAAVAAALQLGIDIAEHVTEARDLETLIR